MEHLPAQTEWNAVPPQVQVDEGLIDVGGARLWYWDTGGDGEAVVFLHPWTGSAAVWGYQQPVFAQAGYRVITYSRRGHLNSETSSSNDNGSTGVGDLTQLVDHLGIEKFHLVGFAGADIVPDFAISYPERLMSVAIGNTIGRPGDSQYTLGNPVLLPQEFLELPTWLKELSPSYRAANPEGASKWRQLEAISKNRPQRVTEKNHLTPELIQSIDLPILLFTGDSDFYMPPSRLRAYAGYWRGPKLVILAESGHAPYWEQPLAFNKMLLDFFRQHGLQGK